jgi:hypothetical protein
LLFPTVFVKFSNLVFSEVVECSPDFHSVISNTHFNIFLPSVSAFTRCSLPVRYSNQPNYCINLQVPHTHFMSYLSPTISFCAYQVISFCDLKQTHCYINLPFPHRHCISYLSFLFFLLIILAVLGEDFQNLKLLMLFTPSNILDIVISICSQTS